MLAQYPRCVAAQAGDLVRGVPRDCKFLPTPADVIAWCERETEPLRGIVHKYDEQQGIIAEMRKRREEGEKAAAARKERPTLEDLKAKYGQNWGIGQADDAAQFAAREVSAARMRAVNETFLLREYAAAGETPREAAPGIPLSRELVSMVQAADRMLHEARMRRAQELGAEATHPYAPRRALE